MEVTKQETPFSLFYQLQNIFFNAEQLNFLKTRNKQAGMTDDIGNIFKVQAQPKGKTDKQVAKMKNNDKWFRNKQKDPIQKYRSDMTNKTILGERRYVQTISKQYMNMEQYRTQTQPSQIVHEQDNVQRQNAMKQMLWTRKANPQEQWRNLIFKQQTINQKDNLIQKHEKMNDKRFLTLQEGSMGSTIINRTKHDSIQAMQRKPEKIQLDLFENRRYGNSILINQGRKEKNGLMDSYVFGKTARSNQEKKQINNVYNPKMQSIVYFQKMAEATERQINNATRSKKSEIQQQPFVLRSANMGEEMPSLNRAVVLERNYLDNLNINKKKLFDADNQENAGTTTIRMQNDFHIQGNEFSSKTEANPIELAEKIGRQIANEIESSVSGWYR